MTISKWATLVTWVSFPILIVGWLIEPRGPLQIFGNALMLLSLGASWGAMWESRKATTAVTVAATPKCNRLDDHCRTGTYLPYYRGCGCDE